MFCTQAEILPLPGPRGARRVAGEQAIGNLPPKRAAMNGSALPLFMAVWREDLEKSGVRPMGPQLYKVTGRVCVWVGVGVYKAAMTLFHGTPCPVWEGSPCRDSLLSFCAGT